MLAKQVIEKTTPSGPGFLFLVPKKDGGQRPVINKVPKQICGNRAFQDGRHPHPERSAKMDGKGEGHILHASNTRRGQKNDTCHFKRLPFGLACAPWVFTKTLKLVAAQLEYLQRHPDPGRVQGASLGPCDRPRVPAGKLELCSK